MAFRWNWLLKPEYDRPDSGPDGPCRGQSLYKPCLIVISDRSDFYRQTAFIISCFEDVMLGWVVGILMAGAGFIAGWFIPKDDVGFAVVQFVIVLIFLAVTCVIILYIPRAIARWKKRR